MAPNRTYQFMVHMENRRNASPPVTGYLLVRVEESRPQMIIIGFVDLFFGYRVQSNDWL